MFESILERVLQRALGDYLEILDKKNLSLGVWSGNINLEDVHIKRTIFQKLKLPLILKVGRIGKLQIKVPWRSLSQSPVIIVIQSVNLIICPKAKSDWEIIDTFYTNFDLKEQLIQQFALALYLQLLKSSETEQQEKGFFKHLYTKVFDNVQVTIQNIHVRLENQESFLDKFSFGMSLKELTVQTTNNSWNTQFFDRTKEINQEMPIFKVLNIQKLGIYWKTNETKFISGDDLQQVSQDQMLLQMKQMFKIGEDLIEEYREYYLLKPIQLTMKLKQLIMAQMLEKEAEFQICLNVEQFSINLQKNQFSNLVKLMEQFNDYSKIQDNYQQTRKYKFLRPVNFPLQCPLDWFRFSVECVRREIRQKRIRVNQFKISDNQKLQFKQDFIRLFKQRFIIELTKLENVEGSHQQLLYKQLEEVQEENDVEEQQIEGNNKNGEQENLTSNELIERKLAQNEYNCRLYEYLIMGNEQEDLKLWIKEAVQSIIEKQDEIQQKHNLRSQTSGGILSYFTQIGSSWLTTKNEQNQSVRSNKKLHHIDRSILEEDDQQQEERKSEKSFSSSNNSSNNQDSDEDEFFDAREEPFDVQKEEQKNLQKQLNQLRTSLIQNFSITNDLKNISESQKLMLNQANSLQMFQQQILIKSEHQREKQREQLIQQAVPSVQVEFVLQLFQICFINSKENQEGIEMYSKDFKIEFKKFDEDNNLNVNSFEIVAVHGDFGINFMQMIERQIYKAPILSKVEQSSSSLIIAKNPSIVDQQQFQQQQQQQYLSRVRFQKGNNNAITTYNDVMLDIIAFDLNIEFRPVKFTYQVSAVQKLYDFFKVKDFKDELKQQAYEKLEAIKQSVSISEVLKNKSKSRLRIDIASPILVIPFKKNNDINSECWIFNSGNMLIQNYEANKIEEQVFNKYKSYSIKVTQIMMQYAKSYQLWLQNSEKDRINVIKEFQMELLVSMKKDQSFLNESKQMQNSSPDTIVSGNMSELKFFFNPHIYNQFLNIGNLMTPDNQKSQGVSQFQEERQQMVNEKKQVIKMATKFSKNVKKMGNAIKYWYQYYTALSGAYLYFYKNWEDLHPTEYYYIKGSQICKQAILGQEYSLLIINQYNEHCCLAFPDKKLQEEWQEAISNKVFEMGQQIAINQPVSTHSNVAAVASSLTLDQGKEQNKNIITDKEQSLIKFEFIMPTIEIQLYADIQTKSEQNKSKGQSFSNQLKKEKEKEEQKNTRSMMTNNNAFREGGNSKGLEKEQVNNEDEEEEEFTDDHIGIFSPAQKKKENDEHEIRFNYMNQSSNKSWSIVLSLNNIRLKFQKRVYDSDFEISLQSMYLTDECNKRYPNIIYSSQNEQSLLIKFIILRQEKDSPRYTNEDMHIDLFFGQMTVNWHPKTINRTIRFIRYNKLKQFVIDQQKDILQMLNQAKEGGGSSRNAQSSFAESSPKFNLEDNNNNEDQQLQQKQNHQLHSEKLLLQQESSMFTQKGVVHNCQSIKNVLMQVNTKLESLKIVFIHPLNNTYPISSIQFGNMQMDYSMFYDHDFYKGVMGSFQIFDHTKYPLTLDPTLIYNAKDEEYAYEILGLRETKEKKPMMEFEWLQYHYPIERTCPLQDDMFDKKLLLKLNSIKLNYMQEYLFRVNDYFYYQFLGAMSDSNPYQKLIAQVHKEFEKQLKLQEQKPISLKEIHLSAMMEEEKKFANQKSSNNASRQQQTILKNSNEGSKWEHFDLQQSKYCTGLNITMDKPLIILKERPYLPGKLELNLGEISINNFLQETKGRWRNFPQKEVKINNWVINAKRLGFKYDLNYFEMAPSFDMKVNFEKLNYTPLLDDSYQSKSLDFLELDISYKIDIKVSQMQLRFRQDVYTFLMRCMDLNINYYDQMDKHFQLYFLNEGEDVDNQKYLKIERDNVRQFANKEVYKQKIYMTFPSISIQVFNYDQSYMSELVLWNASIDFLKYVDYRKILTLKSHTLFVLHNDQEFEYNKNKHVVIGPINSKRVIETNLEFYNLEGNINMSPLKKQKTQTKLSKMNFIVNMNFEPDGEKLIQTKIEKLKIFIKPHIFLMIYEMFIYGLPTYKQDSQDKPNFFDADYGNAPRMEVGCQILSSLLCFENEFTQQKTIACQGNVSFTSIREKANQIKLKLLETPTYREELKESSEGDNSANSNRSSFGVFQDSQNIKLDSSQNQALMQVTIQDLCPFFCDINDLEGKSFKEVRQREMLSPFTLFYNRQSILELAKIKDRLYASQPDRFVFKTYFKTEINLERTLLKISFNDIDILKGITNQLSKMLHEEYQKFVGSFDNSKTQQTTTTKKQVQFKVDDPDEVQVFQQEFQKLHSISEAAEFRPSLLKSDIETEQNEHEQSNDSEEFKSQLDQEELSSEDDDRLLTFKKLRKSLTNEKEKSLKKDASLKGSTGNSGGRVSFRQSIRITQEAISNIKKSYNQKFSLLQLQAVTSDEGELPLQKSVNRNTKSKSQGAEIISQIEEAEVEEDDVDEGATAINTSELKRVSKNQIASKRLLSKRSSELQSNPLQILNMIKSEMGVNQFQVVSHGLKIMVINDNMYNFFPVLDISISEFHYSSDQNENQKAGMTCFSSGLNFYNAEAGEWEPFIETFKIQFTIIEDFQSKKRILQCEVPTHININVTEKLVQNLVDTYKSWQNINLEEEEQEEDDLNIKDDAIGEQNENSILLSDKGGTLKHAKTESVPQNKYGLDDMDEEEDFDYNQKEEDMVTPYSILNQTNVQIIVQRLNNNGGETGGSQSGHSKKGFHKKHCQTLFNVEFKENYQQQKQNRLNKVYTINPGQQIDYAVDYDLQVRHQINSSSSLYSDQHGEFIKILFVNSVNEQWGSPSQMSIPLNNVNLNAIGCKKHYVKDDEQMTNSEYYVYGVSFLNMKKILTIRTPYLFVNKTLFNYEVHIRCKTHSIFKKLAPGDSLPIPDSIDYCKFQIRIGTEQGHFETIVEEEQSPQCNRNRNRSESQSEMNQSTLQDLLTKRGDIANLQQVSKNWSDLLIIKALKTKLPIGRATFLKHGKTYTIIKKEQSEQFPSAFDINFRPPLLLKNCLPVQIQINYIDSNGEHDLIDLRKEEEKHIFVFNLQQNVTLKFLIENYQESQIVLDCSNCQDTEIKHTIFDYRNKSLDIYINTSAKVAGKKVTFFVKNCVIDFTQQDLVFFYSKPSIKQLKNKTSNDIVAGMKGITKIGTAKKKVYMLSDKDELYASISGTTETSNAINITNPGCQAKFELTKDDFLFEYGYSTEIFLATKDDYIYSKITTISPLYVIINQTKNLLIVVQEEVKDIPFVIRKGDRVPFYWGNKDKNKNICFKQVNDIISPNRNKNKEYQWSCGFPISELGTISVRIKEQKQSNQGNTHTRGTGSFSNNLFGINSSTPTKSESKFFRVERRLHNNTIYIIVDEENPKYPMYKIENLSKKLALRYYQADDSDQSESCNVQQSKPFTWTKYLGVKELQVEFFFGDINDEESYIIQDFSKRFQLDQLNIKETVSVPTKHGHIELQIQTYTNGYTKVIKFSDIGGIQEEDIQLVEDENNTPMSLYEIYIKQLNFSIIGKSKELLAIYFQKIASKVADTEVDTKCEFEISYIQVDNQSEIDPLFPVLIKPKYLKAIEDIEDEEGGRKSINLNQQGAFQMSMHFIKNIPNVVYFELIDYLLQTLELKLEFSHMILISNFISDIGQKLNTNLTYMHQIFEVDSNQTNEEDDQQLFRRVTTTRKFSDQHHRKQYTMQSSYSEEDDYSYQQNIKRESTKQIEEVKLDLHLLSQQQLQQHKPPVSQHTSSSNVRSQLKSRTVASSLGLFKPTEKSGQISRQVSGTQQDILRKIYSTDLSKYQQQTLVQRTTWRSQTFKKKTQRIYIKEYRSSPLEVEVSVMKKATFEINEQDTLKTITSMGLALNDIDEAPLKTNALYLNNVFGNYDDVVALLRNHHTQKLKWNVLKLIGASNLLGNPVNFVNALGTGVEDFFYQPRMGFVKGPIQGGIGILKGTGSLVKNTFVGAVGSAGKVVSSVSKGLLVLSYDKEFIYKRDEQKIKKKPRGLVQGMRFGMKNALTSLESGITGVVIQPIEGQRKYGTIGFIKGTAKGVTGLIVKPMSGALDFFSSTTEGIKNSSKREEELACNKRLRLPRAFYEKEKVIRDYDEFHAFFINLVPRLRTDLTCLQFFDACLVECQDSSWSVLVLTLNHLFLIMMQQRKNGNRIDIQWCYETKNIKFVELGEDCSLNIAFQNSCLNLPFEEQYLAEKFRQKLDKIINYYK